MDYNINFKYKSGGGTASSGMSAIAGMRQKAIQASKLQPPQSAKTGQTTDSKKILDIESKLLSSITQLTKAIHVLNSNNKKGIPTPGGAATGIGSKAVIGGAAGGMMVGSVTDVIGFTVQKINQIGNAYIQKVSQQVGSVGVGGFHTNRVGAYLGADIGAGTKAYRMAAGKFGGNLTNEALKMGSIFGLSSEQVGKEAGAFKRFGASYDKTLHQAMGTGIETDLSKFMTAIASEMEEAVKKGVNASDLSGDIGQEVSSLTKLSPTHSVEMAMSMISKFKGTQESAAKGQISNVNTLMSWKGGQEKLLESLNSSNRGNLLKQWEQQGLISKEQAGQLWSNSGKMDLESLRGVVGQGGLAMLTKNAVTSMNPGEALRYNIKNWQKTFGTGAKGMASAHAVYSQMGGEMNVPEFSTAWQNALSPLTEDVTGKGKKKLGQKFAEFEGSTATYGLKQQQMRDAMIYKHGSKFAEASFKMEQGMMKLADTAAPAAIKALGALTVAFGAAAGLIENLQDKSKWKEAFVETFTPNWYKASHK